MSSNTKKRKEEEKATEETIKNSKAIQAQIEVYNEASTKTNTLIDRYDKLSSQTKLTTENN